MGELNFEDVEKIRKIKGKYDELIAKMFSTGYSNELYDEYRIIKDELDGINPQLIQESGINIAIFDMFEQKHQEELKKLEAEKQKIESFNNKYVNILESFILGNNDEINDEVEKYKKDYSKLSKEIKQLVYNNDEVLKKISSSSTINNKKKPQIDESDVTADVSIGLDLTKEDIEEYRNRLVIPFAKQILTRVDELIRNNKKMFEEDNELTLLKKRLVELFYTEIKAPKQIIDGTVKPEDILGSWTYDGVNKMLVYEPSIVIQGEYSCLENLDKKQTGRGAYKIDYKIYMGSFTEKVISTANISLKRKGLTIDYDTFIMAKGYTKNLKFIEKDDFDYVREYSAVVSDYFYFYTHEGFLKQEAEIKEKYDGYYDWDYAFVIKKI